MCWTKRGLAGLWLVLTALPLAAAEPTPAPPIYIESDSLKIDDSKGISVYQGNVIFRQGPDTLWADKLVIHSTARQEVDKIVASGEPARFDHDAEVEDEKSWGEAQTIEYHAGESLLILNGAARFQQGDNLFSGNRIEYEADKELVRAGKAVAGEGRVQIVIQPRSKDTEQQPEASPR